MDNTTVVVIAGPTASGKSALAARLARRRGGVVINADSLQLYAALPILTAQPGPELTQLAPHCLYGTLPWPERATAAWWGRQAAIEIDRAHAAGHLPILVGGTGLYLEALMQGLAPMPDIPPQVRVDSTAELEAMGRQAFYDRLVAADPASARLSMGDTQRLLRAWEVYSATGRSLSDWQEEGLPLASHYNFRSILILPPREILRAACDDRFEVMMQAGVIEEVRDFMAEYPPGWMPRALGLAPIAAHLRGEIAQGEATAMAQAETRQYAKRQVTWFRNRFRRHNPQAAVLEDANLSPAEGWLDQRR